MIDLSKSTRPPGAGWQIIPGGKHGGYRRRKGHRWEYWYPEKAAAAHHAERIPEEDVRKSQAFKSWFGDWERRQGSRVVRADGTPEEQWGEKPVPVYHGTTIGGFSSFDPAHDKGANLYGRGFYFTADMQIAATYAKKDSSTRSAAAKEFEDRGKTITHFSPEQAQAILADVMEAAKAKVQDPYRTAFTVYDGQTLWALAAAREKDGRVNIERFLAEWWKPSDMRAAELIASQAAESIGALEPPNVRAAVDEQMHASWMIDRIARATGVKPSIPEPQVFEVYLNIRKPLDMDAEPSDAQIASLGRAFGGAAYADRLLSSYGLGSEHTVEGGGTAEDKHGSYNTHVKVTRKALLAAKQEWTAAWVDHTENKALRQAPPDKLTWGDVYYIITNGFRSREAQQAFRDWGESEGHDGIRHTGGWNMGTSAHAVWIAWKPTQIKATTAKEFDPHSVDIYKARLVLDLLKAEQLGLFGRGWRPSGGGWEIIPKGKHGGYRRRKGGTRGWEYQYPGDQAPRSKPLAAEPQEVISQATLDNSARRPEGELEWGPRGVEAPAPAPAPSSEETRQEYRPEARYHYDRKEWHRAEARKASTPEARQAHMTALEAHHDAQNAYFGTRHTRADLDIAKEKALVAEAASRATEPAAPASSGAKVYEGGLKMKGPHSPEFTIQRPEGSSQWHLGIAGGQGLPSTSAAFPSLPKLLEAVSGMVDLEDWDERSRAVIDRLSEPGWERMPESKPATSAMHPAIPRSALKGKWVAIAKNADLNKYGYQIVHWIKPSAFAAARAAGPDVKVEAGAQLYEYIPWKDKKLPRYTAITREEQAAVHAAIAPGVHLEQLTMLGGPGEKVRALHGDVPSPFDLAATREDEPASPQAELDVRSKDEKRTEVIAKLMREGKLATADIGWARFALKDVSEQVARDNAGRWRTPEMEAPIREAAAKLYEVEKDADTAPTTARGVREALSIPPGWKIPEREGITPAYTVHLPNDRILNLSWSPKRQQFMGYRESSEYGGASGRYTRVIDKKKVPATDLVAAEIERESAWDAGREAETQREAEQKKTSAVRDPIVQGPKLEIDTSRIQAERPEKGGKQFDNGVEWAARVVEEKMAIPHQSTERIFDERRSHAPGVLGIPLSPGWLPTPRQYQALKDLEGISDAKLYLRARPGQPTRINQPGLAPAKRAFWTAVAIYAREGLTQWTEGEDSPMAKYVDAFRSAVEATKSDGQWLPDVIKAIMGEPVRLVLKARGQQMGLFGGARPPGGGWEIIPRGKHGGYRRRHGNSYVYWYPDKAVVQSRPEPGDEEEKPEAKVEPRLVIAEPRKDEVTASMAEERTKGTRKKDNARAIQIVETARSQGRGLTDEEAVAVAGYTGKGGISGDLNQFYTRTDVAAAMWGILGAYQDRVETVLEPSCGSGVFLQTAPKGTKVTGVELDDAAAAVAEVLHGHKHKVEAKSFELFTIERATMGGTAPAFDAVIANPPYCVRTGDIPRHKPEIKSADQYFIDTSIDHCRDGGTLVMLVHPGIMNAKGPGFREFRERLLARCEVLDAFRLPKDTFKHVQCEIPADIIVLRKRDSRVGGALVAAMGQESLRPTLANLGAWDQGFVDGGYFETRQDRVLGREVSAEETGWRATVDGEVKKAPEAIKRLTEQKINSKVKDPAAMPVAFEALVELGKAHEIVRESIVRAEGALAKLEVVPVIGNVQTMAGQRYLYIGEPPKWTLMESIDDVSQIIEKSGDVAIKKAYDIAQDIAELIRARDAGDFYKARAIRARTVMAVKAWVKENGNPGSHRALVVLSKSAPQLLDFLASVNSVGEPSDVLAKDAAITLKPAEVDRADLMSVAAHIARRNRGYVVMEDVQHNWEGWEGRDVVEVSQILLGSGDYAHTGESMPIQHMEDYLTGNLYEKLDAELARMDAMPEGDERRQVERQIKLIRSRLATKIKSIDDVPIQVRVLGWLPIDWFTRWLNSPEGRRDVFGKKPLKAEDPRARMVYAEGIYSLEIVAPDGEVLSHSEDNTDWLKYMNRLSLKRKRADDVELHFEKAFNDWLKAGELRQPLEELYNRTFNGDFRREYSGDPLPIEGLRPGVVPHDFQNQAVRWAAETGRGILGQDVGLGKTFIAILLARLRKQQGLARRPMVVVPKSVATNWAEEIETLIPGSRVLVIGEHRVQSRAAKKKATTEATAQGLTGEALDKYVEANSWSAVSDNDIERNTKLAAMKQNEYDLIICTKPAFERIPLKAETTEKFEKEDFWYQRAGRIDKIVTGSKQQETADKRIEKLKAAWASDKLQAKFKHEMALVYWEDLGVDTLIADEAHAYKNLYSARSRFGAQPKFLGGSGQSKQARKMQHMARVVRDQSPTNGVYLMTATPTKNSPLEVFNMLQHIAPEAFHAMGIENSEQFIDRFCKMETRLILVPPGKKHDEKRNEEDESEDDPDYKEEFEGAGNLEAATCVTGFTNLRELEGVMDKYMMLQTATDVGLKIPDAKEHTHLVEMTPEQKAIYATLRAEAASTDKREDPGGMFRMLDQMKKAAQDLGLYDPEAYSEWYRRSPKYKACVDEAYIGATERGGQIIFCDHNASHERLRTMLIEKGLAPEQIGIINAQVAPDSEARQRIGDAFNRGQIKVVIGNTGTMGEGVNLQGKKTPKGTTDIHHLDQPWDPGTMHQRNGRGVRQGNKAEQVDIHTYLATGSFDGFRHSTLKGKERWLDKLRSGADSITAGMEGQDVDEVEMLAMLSDNPDEALAKIKERRDSAESAWYAKASQESVDTFYSYQRKVGRLAKMKPGDTRDRLAEDTARINRQLLRNEILPLEIKAVLNAGETQPVAVNTFMTGEGDARRLAARVFRAGMVVEEPRGYGEPGKLVITKINLDERKVEVRTWGHALEHTVQIDQLGKVGYTASKYLAVDELREALVNNIKVAYTTPIEAIGHIGQEVLAANKDMIDEHVRAWYDLHGEDHEIMVRKPEGIVVVPAEKVGNAEIVYPWGKDRAALVEAIVQGNPGPEWRTYTNPLLKTASKEYGYSSYRPTLFTQLAADAESTWKERHAA